MKTIREKKRGYLPQLLAIAIVGLFTVGCEYSTTNDEQTFVVYYENGPLVYRWLPVTDKDDFEELRKERDRALNLLEYPFMKAGSETHMKKARLAYSPACCMASAGCHAG